MQTQLQACRAIIDSITSTGLHESLKPRFEELMQKLNEIETTSTTMSEKRPRSETVEHIEETDTKVQRKYDSEEYFDSHDPAVVQYLLKHFDVAGKFETYLCYCYNRSEIEGVILGDGYAIATAFNVFNAFTPTLHMETPNGWIMRKWRFYESLLAFGYKGIMSKAKEEFFFIWNRVLRDQLADMEGCQTRVQIQKCNAESQYDSTYKFTRLVDEYD